MRQLLTLCCWGLAAISSFFAALNSSNAFLCSNSEASAATMSLFMSSRSCFKSVISANSFFSTFNVVDSVHICYSKNVMHNSSETYHIELTRIRRLTSCFFQGYHRSGLRSTMNCSFPTPWRYVECSSGLRSLASREFGAGTPRLTPGVTTDLQLVIPTRAIASSK